MTPFRWEEDIQKSSCVQLLLGWFVDARNQPWTSGERAGGRSQLKYNDIITIMRIFLTAALSGNMDGAS